jgi:hypothetical protein
MSGQRFTTALEGVPAGGAGLRLPFDPKEEFGKARAPVRVSIGAHPPFRTTVMVYSGVAWTGLRKGQVAEMSLSPGDHVDVLVELCWEQGLPPAGEMWVSCGRNCVFSTQARQHHGAIRNREEKEQPVKKTSRAPIAASAIAVAAAASVMTSTPSVAAMQCSSNYFLIGPTSSDYSEVTSWTGPPNGFTAQVTIRNTGTTAINGWSLAFTFPGDQRITANFNGGFSQIGENATLTNASYNSTIAPGASVTDVFQGIWTSNHTSPTSFSVNSVNGGSCSGGNTVTVTQPASQTGTIRTAISPLQVAATDSGPGQTLTFSATGLPAGLSISSSGLISGTPAAQGSSTVTVTATDGTGAADSASFTWTINP